MMYLRDLLALSVAGLLLGLSLGAHQAMGQEGFVPVCDRTAQIRLRIENLINKDCKRIHAADLAQIQLLDFSSIGVMALKSGDFTGFQGAKELWLHFNSIETIEPGSLDGLTSLKQISLPSK